MHLIKQSSHDCRTTISRLSQDTHDTVARLSHEYQISYDDRVTLIVCRTTVVRSSCNIFSLYLEEYNSVGMHVWKTYRLPFEKDGYFIRTIMLGPE